MTAVGMNINVKRKEWEKKLSQLVSVYDPAYTVAQVQRHRKGNIAMILSSNFGTRVTYKCYLCYIISFQRCDRYGFVVCWCIDVYSKLFC
jgi:hypothetical protein